MITDKQCCAYEDELDPAQSLLHKNWLSSIHNLINEGKPQRSDLLTDSGTVPLH